MKELGLVMIIAIIIRQELSRIVIERPIDGYQSTLKGDIRKAAFAKSQNPRAKSRWTHFPTQPILITEFSYHTIDRRYIRVLSSDLSDLSLFL